MPRSPRRRFVSMFAATPVLALAGRSAVAQPAAVRHRAVFQVSDADPAKWNLALNNVRNVQNELGSDEVELEVVVYGPGIAMLRKGSPVGERVAQTLKNGVKVVACENTMHGLHLGYDDMLPDIGYVPAGVVELMKKQQDGFAYIRP